MSEKNITRVSLQTLRSQRDRGQIWFDPEAPERDDLGPEFWANAEVHPPRTETKSVHLKIDKDVFDFFKGAGKGHLTRMQNVLRAYMRAHQDAAER